MYHQQTEPIKFFYEKLGKLSAVNGVGDVAEISKAIFAVLD